MTEPMTFCILGAAGFIAPRHMEAIRKIGGEIVAAVDPSTAVGVLDRYAPDCRYFQHFEAFLSWLARESATHHVVIATPNDLHAGQALAVQGLGHIPIIEKPVGLSVAEVEPLLGPPAYAILQMREHPEVKRFLAWVAEDTAQKRREVFVTYYAPRGDWYDRTWKCDELRSGGPESNIAIHILDVLGTAYGVPKLLVSETDRLHTRRGFRCGLWYDDAEVRMRVDTRRGETVRRISVADGDTFDLSDASGLHDKWYESLRDGKATTIEDALPSLAAADVIHAW